MYSYVGNWCAYGGVVKILRWEEWETLTYILPPGFQSIYSLIQKHLNKSILIVEYGVFNPISG